MTGHVYKTDLSQGPWDAVVIGSGIGGLATAALLSRVGQRVLVLERHYIAGGFTHTFERKGYSWDVGIHYIGEVERRNSILRLVSDDVTDGRLAWAPMPEVYDRAIFGDETFDFLSGRDRLKTTLQERFPNEKAAIDRYFMLIDEVTASSRGYFAAKALPSPLAAVAGPFLRRRFLKYSDRTTWDVLSSLTSDPKLIGLLTTQYGDYGLPPRRSSFAIHAIVARHYFEGACYPVGGAASIASSVIPVIESAGGIVLVKAEVESILLQDKKVRGVRLTNGDEIDAKVVISDAGVFNTFGKLVPRDMATACGLTDLLRQVHPSNPHVCLYLGIKGDAKSLNLPQSNYWIYPGYDHDANLERYLKDPSAPPPVTYISFPSAKDPAWDAKHPGKSTIEAVGVVNYDWFKKWEQTPWMKRGADYTAFKDSFAQQLLEKVYEIVPQIRGKVDVCELSTPLSTRHFANYDHGEIYGLDHSPSRFRLSWLRPQTPIKGLYLTGQDIVSAGYGGALMGGVLTASALLRRNVLGDILKRQSSSG